MPPWLEVLLDVLGFAGFIGIATLMKSPGEKKQADRQISCRRFSVARKLRLRLPTNVVPKISAPASL
jgi:hypothetical protein